MIEQPQTSKRNFLALGARNVMAIGAIVASATIAKVTPASAMELSSREERGMWRFFEIFSRRHSSRGNCFMKGARIRTVEGERNVEDLAIGDMLPTASGAARPIQWIGYSRYRKSAPGKPWARDVRPVRIKRSALGANIPSADLYVTQTHALFIDGMLVSADRLINGVTIDLYSADEHDELEFFHIKLESHDVIYAEDAPCETLLNVSENANNFASYLRLYGPPAARELACAPISFRGRRGELTARLRNLMSPWREPEKLDIIRDRLAERATSLSKESVE